MGANAVNFANSASNKFRPTFVLQGCKDIDPTEHFEADKVLRRIKELETIAHKKEASRRQPRSCRHSKKESIQRQRSPGELRIAQCYATI
jgi:hypothetical protein